MRNFGPVLAVSALLAGPALGLDRLQAADLPVKASPAYAAVPAFSWNGFYVGGNIGFGSNDFSSNVSAFNQALVGSTFNQAVSAGASPSGTTSGVVGGGQAGVNWVYPGTNFLMGLELDVDGFGKGVSIPITAQTLQSGVNLLGSGRVRAGFTFDKWLVYGTGGVAWAAEDVTLGSSSTGSTGVGWVIGAGVNYAMPLGYSPTSALVWRLEYLHYGLQGVGATLASSGVIPNNGAPATLNSVISASSDNKFDVVRVGADWKF
jgi:outer membrane immunogenic protein